MRFSSLYSVEYVSVIACNILTSVA